MVLFRHRSQHGRGMRTPFRRCVGFAAWTGLPGKQRIFTHDTCRSFGRCVAKKHMHTTKQPYISAKLFRKRLLQYCWKGKKEKASVNERMNAKYHYTSKTKINSDRERMLSLVTSCSVIEGTLSGYLFLKPRTLWIMAQLFWMQQSSLSSAKPALPTEDCSKKFTRLESFCLSLPD